MAGARKNIKAAKNKDSLDMLIKFNPINTGEERIKKYFFLHFRLLFNVKRLFTEIFSFCDDFIM